MRTVIRAARRSVSALAIVAAASAAIVANSSPVQAAQATNQAVSATPSGLTPSVLDGTVFAIGKVGDRIYLGGDFSQASDPGSTTVLTRKKILAFSATTGLIDTTFAPSLDGVVSQIVPGPDNTIYVTGGFTKVNGKSSRLVRLDAATGKTASGWNAVLDKASRAAVLGNGVLYVGGLFSTIDGVPHNAFGAIDPYTGALVPGVSVDFSGRHGTGSAIGEQGIKSMTISGDKSRIAVIGNFNRVTDGGGVNDRDQIAMLNVSGTSASVDRNWKTLQMTGQCANNAFDSWVREIDADPSGTFFVVASTGGTGTNTDGTRALCDSASRWEFSASGANVQPSWVNFTGRDTLLSVSVDNNAVYVGGHQRWLNNPDAQDAAGAGAVARPGVAALDPANGIPLEWNPGRNPRGAGAYAVLSTDSGLYVGSDTEWIGNYRYKRPRIAHFARTGTPTDKSVGVFPGRIMAAGGLPANSRPDVLYRVNAAGNAVVASDGGPNWAADNTDPSAVRTSGSSMASRSSVSLDSTVPSGTPGALFQSERYDTGSAGDGGEMKWHFPVPAGYTVKVRLYMADRTSCRFWCTNRRFSVDLEGSRVLNNLDLVASVGANRGTMREFSTVSDGEVNIDFIHGYDSPLINAIEILQVSPAPVSDPQSTALRSASATSPSTLGALGTADTSMDWSVTRGAFLVGNRLFYGKTDGMFYVRSYDGTTLGTETPLDPYHDPNWKDVDTGSGTTQTYNGVTASLYAQLPSVTSMFYANARVYYTLSGATSMYSRAFSPDSGIVGAQSTLADGKNWSDIAGAFVSGDTMYFASKSTGALFSIAWDGTKAVGSASVLNTANTWSSRSLFLVTRVNQAPTASFTVDCPLDTMTCTVDGSASSDTDGALASYAWDFGDGTTGSQGPAITHTYATPGPREITLVVTDNEGATGVASHQAQPTRPPATVAFRAATSAQGIGSTLSVPVPSEVQEGDTLILIHTFNSTAVTSQDPAGWTPLTSLKNGSAFVARVFIRTASAADAGSTLEITFGGYSLANPKSSGAVLAYSGLDSLAPVASVSELMDSGTSTHVTGTAQVAARGSWAISLWLDKSAVATFGWSTPAELPVRTSVVGGGGSAPTIAIADSAGPVAIGSYGGLSATTTTTSTRGMGVTLVLTAG